MKINLLIADDEELIRKGLIARLSYLGFEFGEILEAETGTEALEAVRLHDISIAVTDIRMPDMDGLAFIREAKKLSPHLRFMVLSGYAEFEYAKTALNLGTSAYLLKPLSNNDLKEEMEKLITHVEQDTRIRRDMTSRKKLEEKNTAYTLEKEVNALLHEPGRDSAGNDKYPAFYHRISSAPENRLLLGIINIEEKSCENNFCKDDTELIRFAVKNVFDEIRSPGKVLLVNSIIHRYQMYAVFESRGEHASLRREVEQFFLEMRAVLEKQMGIYLTMGTSSQTHRLSSGILGEAESALRQRTIYGDGNLYFYEDNTVFSGKSFPSSELYFLEQYLIQGNVNSILKLLSQLFSEEMLQSCGVSYVRILWVRILNLLLKYYEPEIRKYIGVEDLLHNFRTLDELCLPQKIHSYISETISDCISKHGMQDASSKDKIQLATQYIKKHYNENLSINGLAELYNMSPNYFSSVFKKELDQSAVNYITEVRMEKAREYLKDTDLSVIEIAENVGYEDSQYFFRVFKKNTGITPLQYRQQYRLDTSM